MSWCDRRALLTGALATLAGCGFAPVHAPGQGGAALQGRVTVVDPSNQQGYLFTRRIEARLGRNMAAPYLLEPRITTTNRGLGSTSAGETTRYRLDGRVSWTLRDIATGASLLSGQTRAFTGYSATGSTVATLAAERDAAERLFVILADQVVDDLLLAASDLPA